MKTTREYIDEAKTALGIESDYAFAKWLGVPRETVSGYRIGRRVIDDYAAAKIAEALGLPPLQIIATANAERERDGKRRGFWERVAQSAALGLFALAVTGPMPQQVRADQIGNEVHIMRNQCTPTVRLDRTPSAGCSTRCQSQSATHEFEQRPMFQNCSPWE